MITISNISQEELEELDWETKNELTGCNNLENDDTYNSANDYDESPDGEEESES